MKASSESGLCAILISLIDELLIVPSVFGGRGQPLNPFCAGRSLLKMTFPERAQRPSSIKTDLISVRETRVEETSYAP
jgi:Na+-translocating ferredoxin:NAD+ oxidoreductase RnfD subunit